MSVKREPFSTGRRSESVLACTFNAKLALGSAREIGRADGRPGPAAGAAEGQLGDPAHQWSNKRASTKSSAVPTRSRPKPIGQETGFVDCDKLLDLVQQVERVAAVAIELVVKSDDRPIAQPADLEQFAGLSLSAP